MANKSKSLCIIGAGPGGLISAQTFLHSSNSFKSITVFESSPQPGGIWPISKDDKGIWFDAQEKMGRKLDAEMRTNLSRDTVNFGGVRDGYGVGDGKEDDLGMFPKAWRVGKYLMGMADDLRRDGVQIKYGTKVLRVEERKGEEKRWLVRTAGFPTDDKESSAKAVEEDHIFDYLIIASGFFNASNIPPSLKPSFSSKSVPVIHSIQLKQHNILCYLQRAAEACTEKKSQKILVVGASLSGVETASLLADTLSSLAHSPFHPLAGKVKSLSIHHVITKPFWVLPRFVPIDPSIKSVNGETEPNPAPTFMPTDHVLFNLLNRAPSDRLKNKSGIIDPSTAEASQNFLAKLSGMGKPHGAEWLKDMPSNEVPLLAISESYTNHLHSGNIALRPGRLAHIATVNDAGLSAGIQWMNGGYDLDNCGLVVLATGYENASSLGFLSDELKEKLGYEPKSIMPLELCWQSTVHKDVEGLGFVGMYKGAYWGVMEQQAALLADMWCDDEAKSAFYQKALDGCQSAVPAFRQVEGKKEKSDESLTHFPMGDYIHTVSDLLHIRGVRQLPDIPANIGEEGCKLSCIPFLPIPASNNPQLILSSRNTAQNIVTAAESGAFYPRSVFRALLGKWSLKKSIVSRRTDTPSGTFAGTATFSPRARTDEGFSGEYLYEENGTFTLESGVAFQATRRYVYRLSTDQSTVSAWFVKERSRDEVDYLFHQLRFISPGVVSGKSGLDGEYKNLWRATGHHLCIADVYDPEYWWKWQGCEVSEWCCSYDVKGPQKDYTTRYLFTREIGEVRMEEAWDDGGWWGGEER